MCQPPLLHVVSWIFHNIRLHSTCKCECFLLVRASGPHIFFRVSRVVFLVFGREIQVDREGFSRGAVAPLCPPPPPSYVFLYISFWAYTCVMYVPGFSTVGDRATFSCMYVGLVQMHPFTTFFFHVRRTSGFTR